MHLFVIRWPCMGKLVLWVGFQDSELFYVEPFADFLFSEGATLYTHFVSSNEVREPGYTICSCSSRRLESS